MQYRNIWRGFAPRVDNTAKFEPRQSQKGLINGRWSLPLVHTRALVKPSTLNLNLSLLIRRPYPPNTQTPDPGTDWPGDTSDLSLLGPVNPSFWALYERLKLTVWRHKFNQDSLWKAWASLPWSPDSFFWKNQYNRCLQRKLLHSWMSLVIVQHLW